MLSNRFQFALSTGGMAVLLAALLAPAAAAEAGELQKLEVMGDNYPRAFFFRAAESFARRGMPQDEFDAAFGRLMGIEGKVFDEEIPDTMRPNIDVFVGFKARHPRQLVLVHYNGNARDPRSNIENFFAGHWLYFSGSKVLADLPAASGESEIKVADPRLYRVKMGRNRDANEDIGLCELTADGKPDWSRSEQVQLVSVDPQNKTIRVRRGCYGTQPRAFRAGRSYAAAHATEGPWGRPGSKAGLLWHYNYATTCPKDAKGQTCGDVLARELGEAFRPGGRLATLDGIEFDVLYHIWTQRDRRRGYDCNADGVADDCIIDGMNRYGQGVIAFLEALRGQMGDNKLIMADGHADRHQRGFDILNGIESEGWPSLRDSEIKDWSGGLNRHLYWLAHGHTPAFNYINHKFVAGSGGSVEARPSVPMSSHRVVMAAGVMVDAAICYAYAPENERGEKIGIWDELWMGKQHRLGYLGKPLGPMKHLALAAPDLFEGDLVKPTAAALERLAPLAARATMDRGRIRVVANRKDAETTRLRIGPFACPAPELFFTMTASGDPLPGFSQRVPRCTYVNVIDESAAAPDDSDSAGDVQTGGGAIIDTMRHMTWTGQEPFESTFAFPGLAGKSLTLEIVFEGAGPVYIHSLTAHAAPDAVMREFEHGVVLVNPSLRPFTFDLAKLCPGKRFRRLEGSPRQDPKTNNGQPVSGPLTLGPVDAIFLVRQ